MVMLVLFIYFTKAEMNYWLLKTEPDTFSLNDLIRLPDQTTSWEGVRNYQARNYLRSMHVGDRAFFYHSNCAQPAIFGIVEIIREHYEDITALDSQSEYYDPKSIQFSRWSTVDVRYVRALSCPLTLKDLKENNLLRTIPLLKKGNRLSVMPVSAEEWQIILAMENNTIL